MRYLRAGLCLCLPAGFVLAGAVWDAEGPCGYLEHAVCEAAAARGGERGYVIKGGATATLSDFIEIDPARAYELSGWFRSGPAAEMSADFGWAAYDAAKRPIHLAHVQVNDQTLSRLAADAAPGDTSILIEGSLRGYTAHTFMPVAFHVRADCGDLPNRDLSGDTLVVRAEAEGIRVTFATPLTNHYPKGTAVRQHNRIGASHQWTGFAGKQVPREWQECRAAVAGGSAVRASVGRFWPGTRYVRLVVRAQGGREGSVHADDLDLKAVGPAAPETPLAHEPFFQVQTDRLDALYACGEKAEFRVVRQWRGLDPITNGVLTATFTLDGGRVVAERMVNLAGVAAPPVFRETLAEPGFLQCAVAYADGTNRFPRRVAAAAGFSVERIRPGAPPPDDLLQYWRGELARLEREVPFDLRVTVEKEDAQTIHYRLSGAHFGGTRITAGLTMPKAGGPFPLRVTVPGAGNSSTPMTVFPGCIGLSISVFDRIFGPGDYEAFNNPEWYFYKGTESRETYYYHKAILGAMRMVTYALGREEWDRKNFFVNGFSQGGGFSLILAGLFADVVTGVAAGAPALCDHGGAAAGRMAGWPQLVATRPAAAAYAGYYDAAHFATHIRCPVIVSVGFIDTMCVPSSVYAAYNVIPSAQKRIFNAPLYGHGWGVNAPEFGECLKTFFETVRK